MHSDSIFGKLIPRSIALKSLRLFYLFLYMAPLIFGFDTQVNIFQIKLEKAKINLLSTVSMKDINSLYCVFTW